MLQNAKTSLPTIDQSHSSDVAQFPRNLSLIETWGFGLTGLLLWMGVAPGTQAELGTQAMWVWIPGAIIGVLINIQVRALGKSLPNVSGGTPNYLTHLLEDHPTLTRYAALGYFISWVAVLPVNAIILTDLVNAILDPLGVAIPDLLLRIGFTVLAFIVAFSGSHALGTLHLIFLLPAVGLLLAFCLQGGYAITALSVPMINVSPAVHPAFSLQGWAKWYLIGTYAFYACETASAFVADSKRPEGTLNSLLVAAGLIPVVYIGGSWVLLHLATAPGLGDDTSLHLLAAAQPFWGPSASFLVTFLVVSSSLLSCGTAVAICPRILYQLAQDRQLAPIFGVTSSQGVFTPGLLLTLLLSLLWLTWGNVHQIVMITAVGWLICFTVLHWGLWQQREKPEAVLPHLSLGLCIVEAGVLVVGGLAWGLQDLLIGVLLPIIILGVDWAIQQASWGPLTLDWWTRRSVVQSQRDHESLIALQVLVLILFIFGATIASWCCSVLTSQTAAARGADLLVVLILVLSFIGIAIACWTIFPKIVAVNEARQQAEQLSTDLQQTLQELQAAQSRMVQQEKMSSLGRLVAGVAHEINNPVNFIHGNVTHAQTYVKDLLNFIQLYQQHYPKPGVAIETEAKTIDLEFIQDDLVKLLKSMKVGTDRIRQIVLSLRHFSRMDEAEFKAVNVHEGIDNTLMMLEHRLKGRPDCPTIEVIQDYAQLPLVECYPGQLNQVVMNLLANAIDALEEANGQRTGQETTDYPHQITIRTSLTKSQWVTIAIADNGSGIPETVRPKIFDPFFTTKAPGKGTGMGLSISYQIIVENHGGTFECVSVPDQGTEFMIQLPIQQRA